MKTKSIEIPQGLYTPLLQEVNVLTDNTIVDFNKDPFVQSVITSPPYFQQVCYGLEGQLGLEPTIQEYIANQKRVMRKVHTLLVEGGTCWIVIGDTQNNRSPVRNMAQRKKKKTKRKEESSQWQQRRTLQHGYLEKEPLRIPELYIKMMRELSFVHRATMIWDKIQPGSIYNPKSDAAPISHEYILQFGKWSKTTRPYLKCKPLRNSVIRCMPSSHPTHPAPFPETLVERLLMFSTEPGDIVLDPYVGTGTTALCAYKNGRVGWGLDLDISYARSAFEKMTGQKYTQLSLVTC